MTGKEMGKLFLIFQYSKTIEGQSEMQNFSLVDTDHTT